MTNEDIKAAVDSGVIIGKYKFVAIQESYGSKPPSTRKERAVMAKAAKAAIGRAKGVLNTASSASGGKTEKSQSPTKQYGSHNGQTHVYEISDFRVEDGVDAGALDKALSDFVRAVSTAESLIADNLDVDQMKRECESKDLALELEFRKLYGNRLSEQQATNLRLRKSQNAFRVWKHQVVLTVYSKECLKQDLSQRNDAGYWVTVFRSKAIWRESRIPLEWIQANLVPTAEAVNQLVKRVQCMDLPMCAYQTSSGKILMLNERQYVRKISAGESLSRLT